MQGGTISFVYSCDEEGCVVSNCRQCFHCKTRILHTLDDFVDFAKMRTEYAYIGGIKKRLSELPFRVMFCDVREWARAGGEPSRRKNCVHYCKI